MFCSKCGSQNAEDARFCRQCGNSLNSVKKSEKKNSKTIYYIIGAVVILIAVIVAIVLGMRGKKAKEYETYLASAEKYMEELNYEQAKDYYLQAINIAPRELEPYVKLAWIYVDLEEIEKAEEVLIKAEENNASGSEEIQFELEAVTAKIKEYEVQEETVTEPIDDAWKEKYIEFINSSERTYDEYSGTYIEEYKLIDINGDDIPELYTNFGSTAGGEIVCTYIKGQFYEQWIWDRGLSYIEGENIFMDTGGHMGAYHNKIYEITDEGVKLLLDGTYAEKTETLEDYEYYLDGKNVTERAYYEELAKYFDENRAIRPLDNSSFNSDTGHYEGNGICLYDEIIRRIEAYPEIPEASNALENIEERDTGKQQWELELEQTEQESEELEKLFDNAMTQYDLNLYSYQLYTLWDDEINALWGHLKNNLSESEMEALTIEQREWIKEKEAAIEDAGKEWEGGSGQPMAENYAGWTSTEARVYELIEYLR